MAGIPRDSYRVEGHTAVGRYAKWGDGLEWADSLLIACCAQLQTRACHLWFADAEGLINGRAWLSDVIPVKLWDLQGTPHLTLQLRVHRFRSATADENCLHRVRQVRIYTLKLLQQFPVIYSRWSGRWLSCVTLISFGPGTSKRALPRSV